MKNVGTIVAALFVAAVLLTYMCTFKVRFTEVAIKKTWGQPAKDAITEPGLKFKWPTPIQSVVKYDKRVRILEDRTEETRTVDGKNVVLTTFALWKIVDPSLFHTNFPAGEEDGERKLRSLVITQKQAVTAQHSFDQFVSTDSERLQLSKIEGEMRERIAADTGNLGVEIVGFGIKKLALPQSVTSQVFDTMKAAEEAKAARYIAEGNATASDIQARAKAVEARIMSSARRKVAEIETEAQRLVSAYYEEFKENPELRMFLDSLQATKLALKKRSTLILDTQEIPFDVFERQRRDLVRPDNKSNAGDPSSEAEPAAQNQTAEVVTP